MVLFYMLVLAANAYKVRAKGIINFNAAWINWVFERSDFVADATTRVAGWFACALALTTHVTSVFVPILLRALALSHLGCTLP